MVLTLLSRDPKGERSEGGRGKGGRKGGGGEPPYNCIDGTRLAIDQKRKEGKESIKGNRRRGKKREERETKAARD